MKNAFLLRVIICTLVFCATCSAIIFGWQAHLRNEIAGVVPRSIKLQSVVYSGDGNFAIFKIPEATAAVLKARGAAALANDVRPRDPEARHGFVYVGWFDAPLLTRKPLGMPHISPEAGRILGRYADGAALKYFLDPPKMNSRQYAIYKTMVASAFEGNGVFSVNDTNEVIVFVDVKNALCLAVIGEN